MSKGITRRKFVQASAAATAGYWVAGGVQAEESKAANERIQFACIGIGGKGSSDSGDAERHGDIVGICDADKDRLKNSGNRKGFGNAKQFVDYREMLDQLGDKIDAVTVSTPDHNHACASIRARSGATWRTRTTSEERSLRCWWAATPTTTSTTWARAR